MAPAESSPIRILLVDDEADLVEFLSHLLLKRGWTVTAAYSGIEALAAVEAQTFDVAILDLRMPEMDGIEVLEKIRATQPYLEVIMLTGHGTTDSALEAGRLNVFRYLHKPYQVEDLMVQIQEAFEHREQLLEEGYEREIEQIITPGNTPKDIIARGEALRRKYFRD